VPNGWDKAHESPEPQPDKGGDDRRSTPKEPTHPQPKPEPKEQPKKSS
jgi:hypothetical protein